MMRNLAILPALLLAAAFPANAQTAADDEDQLEDELEEEFELLQDEGVVFSAARHRQDIAMSPSAITVITRSQIETAAAFSVVDLLRRVPGMDVMFVSMAFTAVCARLPTTYENHLFLVLIDGRQANVELWGQAPWEIQPISIDDIERIEIIRGPASALYGANAFAGVISITTRSVPKISSAWVQAEGGSFGRTQAGGRLSTSIGDFGFSVGTAYDVTGDFGDARAEGKEIWKARGVAEYRPRTGTLLRLDVSGGVGGGPMPTGMGIPLGDLKQLAVNVTLEHHKFRAQANYLYSDFWALLDAPIMYGNLKLAEFAPLILADHDVDGEVQWTLPELWPPLMLIMGGKARGSFLSGPNFLDAASFPRDHRPGIEYREFRGGAFLHAELKPVDWLTLTASGRADYNTDTGFFLSPRAAGVARLAEEQFLRLSAARAFRKPAYLERHMHPLVTFPPDSPLQGGDQTLFLEFMTRVVGNDSLVNEELWAFELGYDWRPAEGRLEIGLDTYLNVYSEVGSMVTSILQGAEGLPDLRNSSAQFEVTGDGFLVAGLESYLRYSPLDWLTLRAAWSYRAVWQYPGWKSNDGTAKNLYYLGAEFLHPSGFLGSLYAYGRSEVTCEGINNPKGVMEPMLTDKLANNLLLLGRVGFRWKYPGMETETGLKLALPLDLSSGRLRMRDHGGGITPAGLRYGGTEWRPLVMFYLSAGI